MIQLMMDEMEAEILYQQQRAAIKTCSWFILFGCFPWLCILSICGTIVLFLKLYGYW